MEQEQIKIKFEDLQKRAQKINEAGIKLNTQIEHAQQVLSKIKENALKLYKNLGYKIVGYADWRMGRFYLMEKFLAGN